MNELESIRKEEEKLKNEIRDERKEECEKRMVKEKRKMEKIGRIKMRNRRKIRGKIEKIYEMNWG
jgi:hypothetical protein